MQAIVTRYLGPTDTRGSRIKATADAGSVTIPYPHELSGEAVHRAAAEALLVKLGWDTAHGYRPFRLVGGGLPQASRDSYAFVIVPTEPAD
jgi:hypothetical protein